MMIYYMLLFLAVFLAAAGQVMLKIGVGAGGLEIGFVRLNSHVFFGLGAMVASMLLSVRGLSVVPLRDIAFILPTVYIAVPAFSWIFLKERPNGRVLIGSLIMIVGIMMFNIPMMRIY